MTQLKKLLRIGLIVLLLVSLAGCADAKYSITITKAVEYNSFFTVTINKNVFIKSLKNIGQQNPEKYIEDYIMHLKESNPNIKDLSSGSEIRLDIKTEGKVSSLDETTPHTASIFYVQEAKDGKILANIPVYSLVPRELINTSSLNTIFDNFTVEVSFSGSIDETNFDGQTNIFTNTVTWDTDAVIESIKQSSPLIAIGGSSQIIGLMQLTIFGLLILLIIIISIVLTVKLRKRKRNRTSLIIDAEVDNVPKDWDNAMPEDWALRQISSGRDKIIPMLEEERRKRWGNK